MADSIPNMTSHRPYLLRALYEWIVDNGMTPHVLVDATRPGVRVPPHTVRDGRVVLNIAERAVGGLTMDNEGVRFSARFGGVSQLVVVPVDAVVAIYARETGHGMVLPEDPGANPGPTDVTDEAGDATGDEAHAATPGVHGLALVDTSDAGGPSDDGDDDGDGGSRPPPRGFQLRVVK